MRCSACGTELLAAARLFSTPLPAAMGLKWDVNAVL